MDARDCVEGISYLFFMKSRDRKANNKQTLFDKPQQLGAVCDTPLCDTPLCMHTHGPMCVVRSSVTHLGAVGDTKLAPSHHADNPQPSTLNPQPSTLNSKDSSKAPC